MSTTEGDARRQYYGIDGVPTAQIDGAMVTDTTGETFGGGGRDRAGVVFERYAGLIDAALEQTVEAALAVRGTISGDKVTVGVDVTTLPAAAAGLQLQIVLAERDLLFGGENGIRHHSMVVRAIAGISGQGLPLAAAGTTQHVFDLAAVRADITRSLTADIGRRRAGGGGAQEFAAEDRAMTTIDPARLIVAAYVQTKDRRVLQAAWSAVAPAAK